MRMARPYAARLNVVKENGDLVTYCEVKETRRDAYKRALPDGIAEKTGSALSQAIQCGEPRLQPSCAPAGSILRAGAHISGKRDWRQR
jgi:hypothetical protein